MHPTEPQVFLVGYPQVRLWTEDGIPGLLSYLEEVGADEFAGRFSDQLGGMRPEEHGQALVEIGGRECYRSWQVGLNPNIRKVREDSAEYALSILGEGKDATARHGSVTEHAQYSFIFHNISRVATHELVRHRVGVAISQESLRYVRLDDLGFRIPDILANGPDISMEVTSDHDLSVGQKLSMRESIVSIVERLEDFQRSAAEAFGLDDDGVPFHYKKEVTSALRRLAPLGLSTGMMWSANIRTLRHVLTMRTAKGAEEEIRMVFNRVGEIMQEICPWYFSDYTVDEDGQWITENWKV